MYGLSTCQHGHILLNPLGAGLGRLCIVDAVEDGVAIGAFELREERFGFGRCVKRRPQIIRNLGPALRCVGSSPAPVGLRFLDLSQTGGGQPSFL
jgi:hypothetical protein